jgi:hypothetical protein
MLDSMFHMKSLNYLEKYSPIVILQNFDYFSKLAFNKNL